ncbi:MAG TPA: CHRD domain-containing protein [Candidatus Methylomirabilis sp.]|nr:CHRD domain-containing protein [Candidatus Methylomirabilis sp.]
MRRFLWVGVGTAALLLAGCAGPTDKAGRPTLTGSQEVPPVNTTATGTADIAIHQFKCPAVTSGYNCATVVGFIQTNGINPTAVHIHMAPAGQNGPVIVTLTKTTDSVWSVPPNTVVTDDQYRAWWAGNTYVNAHTAANPGGEIRAQLHP